MWPFNTCTQYTDKISVINIPSTTTLCWEPLSTSLLVVQKICNRLGYCELQSPHYATEHWSLLCLNCVLVKKLTYFVIKVLEKHVPPV
jgi:hypothetical protein